MFLVYILGIFVALGLFFSQNRISPRGLLILVFVLIIGVIPPLIFPVFKLPQPTGSYPVGVQYLAFTDSSRQEIFSQDPSDLREITAKIWYPSAESAEGDEAPYILNTKKAGAVMAKSLGLPSFIFNHFTLIKTHAIQDATVAQGSFPVLIFSHGWGGFFGQNTALMEEMASQGYIVVSIAHHYDAPFTNYPDGTIRVFNQIYRRTDKHLNPDPPYDTDSIFKAYLQTEDEATIEQQLIDFTHGFPGMEMTVYVWAEDIKATVDFLIDQQANDFWDEHADFDKLGYLGMSFGGASSGQACLTDPRCKAAINMDGTQFGDMLQKPMDKPILFMHNALAGDFNAYFAKRAESQTYSMIIEDTEHFNFTDFPLYSPIFKNVGFLGDINSYRNLEIVNRYTLSFFDKHLKGVDNGLLDSLSTEFFEVTFKTYNRKGKVSAH